MLTILRQIAATGIKTEDAPAPDEALTRVAALQAKVLRALGRALAIRHVDAGSCNGCELEINALQQSVLQPRRARHPLRREPAARGHAARHRTGVEAHGGRAEAHLRRDTRPQARRRGRRLRLRRRDLRRGLRDRSAALRTSSRSMSRCRAARRRPPRCCAGFSRRSGEPDPSSRTAKIPRRRLHRCDGRLPSVAEGNLAARPARSGEQERREQDCEDEVIEDLLHPSPRGPGGLPTGSARQRKRKQTWNRRAGALACRPPWGRRGEIPSLISKTDSPSRTRHSGRPPASARPESWPRPGIASLPRPSRS